MSLRCEVAVLGLGAMGSATLLELSRRGVSAIGLDRETPPHTLGSSHGKSRIIREAYYEDPVYVPIVRRAYERWALLEQETGSRVFRKTGGLMLFVQYPGPTTNGRPIYDGRFNMKQRRPVEEETVEV